MPDLEEHNEDNEEKTSQDDPNNESSHDSDGGQTKISSDTPKQHTDQGIGGPLSRPMTADPYDTQPGASKAEKEVDADYWRCPYCPDFKDSSLNEVRDHITRQGDDLHAGQSGWSHDRHIPGFNADDELVGAELGLSEMGDEIGIVPIDRFPDDTTFTTHTENLETIPMSLQDKTDESTDEQTDSDTEQQTEADTDQASLDTQEIGEDDVLAWVCPYCTKPSESEHGIRLHITNSSGGVHEDKDGWDLDDYVPGINAAGDVVAALDTGEHTDEEGIIPSGDIDAPPEIDQDELANISDEIENMATETATDDTDSETDDETEVTTDDPENDSEPLTGEKKIRLVNGWVSAGNLESELGLSDDEQFGPEDVSDVVGPSYSYTYTVGQELKDDDYEPESLEEAFDEDLQEEFREGFEERLAQRPKQETETNDEQPDQDEETTQEQLAETTTTRGTTDEEISKLTDAISSSEEDSDEKETARISIEGLETIQNVLTLHKASAEVQSQNFSESQLLNAVANQRHSLAEEVEEMIASSLVD